MNIISSILGAILAVSFYWVVGEAGGTRAEQLIGSLSGWAIAGHVVIISMLDKNNK